MSIGVQRIAVCSLLTSWINQRSHSLCLFPGVSFLVCPLQSLHRHGNHPRWRQPPILSAIENEGRKRIRAKEWGEREKVQDSGARERRDLWQKQISEHGNLCIFKQDIHDEFIREWLANRQHYLTNKSCNSSAIYHGVTDTKQLYTMDQLS